MDPEKLGFSSKALKTAEESFPETGSFTTPIYQTSTFDLDKYSDTGYVYTRVGNPTQAVLEEKMAVLEGGEGALASASGMAAISSTVFTLAEQGDHIVCSDVVYGGTYDFFTEISRFGMDVSFVNTADLGELEDGIRDDTQIIFLETPANPNLKLSDIKAISEIAEENDIDLLVDNTLMSPYFQRPIELGADVVVHSATKYIGGHGDTLGGVIVGPSDLIQSIRSFALKDIGGSISPFNAWLLIRGLKTLSLRMEKHEKNAMEIAEFLQSHDKVQHVAYPGLKSFPQYELAKNQMDGFGGMIAFQMENESQAGDLVNNVEVCSFAVSLGDVDTLIEIPAFMTHRSMSEEERIEKGIENGLVRLSVGIEDVEDLIQDLDRALEKI